MNSPHSKTILSVYSTLTFMLLHLWLNAQTPCPNLVTNGNFEAATSIGFTSVLPVDCGCVLNTHCVTTNFNLKCPSTFPNYGDNTTGTGKFLLAQNSLAANVWQTNVTVTPNAPYTFSFWVARGPFYPVAIAMMVNNVNVNQFTVSQTTPLWTKYTYSGICPAGVTNLPIAIRQISFGEAYSFGIDDVSFVSCSCDCPSGNIAVPNVIVNGDFSAGNTGFTNDFTYFTNGTATNITRYSVLNSTEVILANNQWACTGNTTGTTSDQFLVVDGIGNGPTAWRQTVPTVVGAQYKFCFVANNLVVPARDYFDPIMEVWVNGVRVAGPITLSEIPDVWVPISASWTATTTSAIIEIQTASPQGVGNDFAIDDIKLSRCSNCQAAFTFDNLGNCGNFVFNNTSVTPGLDRPDFLWNFNDIGSGANNTSTAQSPTHQFSTCGTYNVCLTVTSAGCTSTFCQTITVSDNVNPVARCKPGVGVILNADCRYIVTPAFVDNGSTDNCLLKSITVNPTTITGCGNTTVTLTATDWCNNTSTCTMGIQTTETTPPTIICPPNTTVTCTTDTIPSVTGVATATDNCPGPITITRSDVVTGSLPCDGLIRRTWVARDACGNTSSCIQSIFVRDNVPPVITCRRDTTVFANQLPCSKLVNGLQFLSVTDNCSSTSVTYAITGAGANVISGQTNASGLIFNSGTSTVTYTATDACNNKSTCSFNVTVFCDTLPCLACVGGVSGTNLITNGSFTAGNAGFTSGLNFSGTCGTGNYGITTNFTSLSDAAIPIN